MSKVITHTAACNASAARTGLIGRYEPILVSAETCIIGAFELDREIRGPTVGNRIEPIGLAACRATDLIDVHTYTPQTIDDCFTRRARIRAREYVHSRQIQC